MEDALYATKASIDEGIVPGGGFAYLRAAQRVNEILDAKKAQDAFTADRKDAIARGETVEPVNMRELPEYVWPDGEEEWAGFRLVLLACEEPLRQIVDNAGLTGAVYVRDVLRNDNEYVGVDATDMQFKDMLEAGIIDPTKVVRCALTNAVSVVSTVLLTEAIVRNTSGNKPTNASV